MGRLTQEEIAKYALALGKSDFFAVCDTEGCGKLITHTDFYMRLRGIALKYEKRNVLNPSASPTPIKFRCHDCCVALNPPKEEVSVKGAGRGAKKLSLLEASKLSINPEVRRRVVSILKKLEPKKVLTAASLLALIRRKRTLSAVKPKEIRSTLRAMRKLRLIKYTRASCSLVPEKTGKNKKNKQKKVSK